MNPPTINHPQCRPEPAYVKIRNAQIPEADIMASRAYRRNTRAWYQSFTWHMDRLTRIAMGQGL